MISRYTYDFYSNDRLIDGHNLTSTDCDWEKVIVEEFEAVKLKNGRIGAICDVVKPSIAFFVDFEKPMDSDFGRKRGFVTFDTELVEIENIAAVGTAVGAVESVV